MDKVSVASHKLSTAENSLKCQSTKLPNTFSLLCTREQMILLQKLMPVKYSIVALSKSNSYANSFKKKVNVLDIYKEIFNSQTNVQAQPKRSEQIEEQRKAREQKENYRNIKGQLKKLQVRLSGCSKSLLNLSSKKSNELRSLLEVIIFRVEEYVYESWDDFETDIQPFLESFPDMRRPYQKPKRKSSKHHQVITEADDEEADSESSQEEMPLKSKKKSYQCSKVQATTKKAKRTNHGDEHTQIKPLTLLEKKNLSYKIRQLPTEHLWSILSMVKDNSDDTIPECIDINLLSPRTVRKIEHFVSSKLDMTQFKKASKKKTIKSPVTAAKQFWDSPKKTKYEEAKISDVIIANEFLGSEGSFIHVDPCAKTMGPSLKPIDQTESSFLSDLDD